MNFHILTLFPEMVMQGLNTSIIGRASRAGLLAINAINIRDYSENKHHNVDDYPYGGGAGMLMQAQPVYDAWKSVVETMEKTPRCVYVTPQGSTFTQKMAKELALEQDLILLCGHYEGIDERVLEEIVTDYVSIGDYVLTGGELPAMVITDAVSRMVPGVLGNQESGRAESFEGNLLEYPQYSRPEDWRGKKVPEVLLSGHHKNIEIWRRRQAVLRTRERRPDLLEKAKLSSQEQEWLKGMK
ncbi:tRNA (guanosine(37)-N1)-methyltransferase TrmD [Lachnospiraceae bacterium]|nr:tRNA (guanosine(37)-N1)-methyltransferase TrmD [Lachnospiraceae bacterium]